MIDTSFHWLKKAKILGLTLCALMDSSFWFSAINLEWSIEYIEGSQVIISKENCAYCFLDCFFFVFKQ